MADEINAYLMKLTDNTHIFYLDSTRAFRSKEGKKKFLRDGVHPSPAGYEAMAAILKGEIEKLLSSGENAKKAVGK